MGPTIREGFLEERLEALGKAEVSRREGGVPEAGIQHRLRQEATESQLGKVDETGIAETEVCKPKTHVGVTCFLPHPLGNKGLHSPKLEEVRGLDHHRIMWKAYENCICLGSTPDLRNQSLCGEDPRESAFHQHFRVPDVQ